MFRYYVYKSFLSVQRRECPLLLLVVDKVIRIDWLSDSPFLPLFSGANRPEGRKKDRIYDESTETQVPTRKAAKRTSGGESGEARGLAARGKKARPRLYWPSGTRYTGPDRTPPFCPP